MTKKVERATAFISLKNAEHNFRVVKRTVKTKVCCVVKANAYGHGGVKMATLYQNLGADYLAVATIDEAITLRKAKISLPILILGYTPISKIKSLIKYNLTQTVYSFFYAEQLLEKLKKLNDKLKVHIKIDTGMNRQGFSYKEKLSPLARLCQNPLLLTEGVYTHFSLADDIKGGKAFTKRQYARFTRCVDKLLALGAKFSIRHCSNSSAIFLHPEFKLDMVRAGIALYGGLSSNIKTPYPLKPVMSVKAIITQIKWVKKGERVGYGKNFKAQKDTLIATVSMGYADGINRNYSGFFAIKNSPAKVVGRVCMDSFMLDVTGLNCAVGEKVTIFGDYLTAEKVAGFSNTISYEVLCAVSSRVPRVYV